MYKLDEKTIEEFNGQPDSVTYCDGMKVLIYNQGLETVANLNKANVKVSYPGCRLPNSTGINQIQADACSLKSVAEDYSGNLTYGPFVKLDPGNYEFDLNYISKNPLNKPIGNIDISFLFPASHEIVSTAPLMGSDGTNGHLKGKVSIDDVYKKGLLEVRTFIEKNTDIEILSLSFMKIK